MLPALPACAETSGSPAVSRASAAPRMIEAFTIPFSNVPICVLERAFGPVLSRIPIDTATTYTQFGALLFHGGKYEDELGRDDVRRADLHGGLCGRLARVA